MVTVIIPNYNGSKYIRECLDSLRLQNYKNFNIIVVDNASTDGSDLIIEEEYNEVQLIRNASNLGFSSGVNIGIKAAKSEYVILLNNDAMVEYNFIEEMVKGISSREDIFSCCGKILQYNSPEKIDDAGDFYTIMGIPYQRGLDESRKKYKKSTRIFSSCAGAAIYRRELFEKVGYFDELHFAYLEDVDIGFRANILGYINIYLPRAITYHIGSASSGERYNEFKIKLAARNSIYVYYKNMPVIMLIFNLPFIVFGHAVKYLFFKKKGFEKIYLSGIKEALGSLLKCKKVEYNPDNLHNYLWIERSLIESLLKKIGG